MSALDESARRRLLETFLDLVRIDSPSGSEAACAVYCADALAAAGCSVRFDESARVTGSDTGNVIAVLSGTVDATLVLSAHMDCVDPCSGVDPVISDGTVFSAGETVLGADDKAGLAAAIECVRALAADPGDRPTIRCVFTVQEEVGLRGAKALAPSDVSSTACLVLDADGVPGGIVSAAPTHHTFTAEFIGRASHAGVAPEAGISAVAMASDAISRMRIGRLDVLTTANVGGIHGGGATNVITARVDISGECRSLDRETADSLRDEMDATMRAAAERAGGEVRIVWTREYEGFSVDETAPVVRLVQAACTEAGLESRLFSSGGGSDANIIASLGVPTVALSCGMSGVHSTGEQIAIAHLEALTELCIAVARGLVRAEG